MNTLVQFTRRGVLKHNPVFANPIAWQPDDNLLCAVDLPMDASGELFKLEPLPQVNSNPTPGRCTWQEASDDTGVLHKTAKPSRPAMALHPYYYL